jgi:hypothetical protein
VIVPVLETVPTRIMTMPPPAAPLETMVPVLLFRVPAPPPAPRTTCAAEAGKTTPP